MSSLKVNQIKTRLRALFEQHLDLNDVSEKDSDRDSKILSRCLAALAIYLEAACSPKDAAEAVWDGSDDNGIDAAYFDASSSRVLLVQSKWIAKGSGEPEAKEIGVFIKGARDAIENNIGNFHPRLQSRINDILLRLSTPGVSIELIVISTGHSTLAKHGTNALDQFMKELNGDVPDPIATYQIKGLVEAYSGLANDPLQSSVTVDVTMLDWSYIAAPYPAYFGLIDGLQLKELWKKHGKGLVSQNIRHSLGSTDVNK